MDLQLGLLLLTTVLGGLNLAFVLKIMLNDIHELRAMIVRHLEEHGKTK